MYDFLLFAFNFDPLWVNELVGSLVSLDNILVVGDSAIQGMHIGVLANAGCAQLGLTLF